jgi:hypothetical protein
MTATIMQLSQSIKAKIAKFAKFSFCESSRHECDFNRASYADVKSAFSVSDKKYYKSCERIDTLTMTRDAVMSRVAKVSLFDRKQFEREFDFEATYDLCCNSKAVALNLCQHERKYSTLYRHLALYSNRADLYLLCAMSNTQRATCFRSDLFLRAVAEQSKVLTTEQIQKAVCSDKKYAKFAEQLKSLMLDSKKQKATATINTAKLVAVAKAVTKVVKAKAVAVKK